MGEHSVQGSHFLLFFADTRGSFLTHLVPIHLPANKQVQVCHFNLRFNLPSRSLFNLQTFLRLCNHLVNCPLARSFLLQGLLS